VSILSHVRGAADHCSEFIKHLISVPSDQKLSQAPIQLEYNQIAVRRFIDLMCISTGTSIFIEISLHKEILGLCDMFQAPTIAQIVLDTLTANLMSDNPGTQLDAWDIFKVAAIRDDIVLAKAAIRAFDSLGHDAAKMIATEEPSFYDGIPSRYVYALSRAVVRQPGPESRGYRGSSIHMKSSKQISEAFALS
jgi:hypothetical protein